MGKDDITPFKRDPETSSKIRKMLGVEGDKKEKRDRDLVFAVENGNLLRYDINQAEEYKRDIVEQILGYKTLTTQSSKKDFCLVKDATPGRIHRVVWKEYDLAKGRLGRR